MLDFQAQYRAKRISQSDLAGMIQSGDTIQFGVWYGQPYGAIRAISERAAQLDRLYVSMNFATGAWEYMNAPGVIVLTGFFGPFDRAGHKAHNNFYYTPFQYCDCRRVVSDGETYDYFIFRVAPMDSRGCFNFSFTSSWEYRAIKWLKENRPETKIVFEVNPRLPRVFGLPEFGNNELPISYCDCIVEDDSPLLDFPCPAPTEREQAIAANVAGLVEDKATVQLGFGTIPMAIGALLKDRRGLGIHSEMFCEAQIDLIQAGSVTNEHKGLYDGISVGTFGLGEERLRTWMKENKQIAMLPVEEINAAPVLAKIKNMTSINSALTIDLTGQACAHCLGSQTYSGLGGAFEFASGAQLSPGGKSITCLPSVTALKDGTEVSNVVACHPLGTRITIPEHTTDWVATEYGAAHLKFMNLEQRAAALIDLAHPKFREDLARQARERGFRMNEIGKLKPLPERHFYVSDMVGSVPQS